ncbi:MAG: zinc ribbon domain-containing protein [Planctomycetes bacterium]|nr:zinc ribbon domain-containing protein [Planctomycetota bacterium]
MKCPDCGEEHPDYVRSCPVCGHDVGFPNVRAAAVREETEALTAREESALHNAEARGCAHVVEQFRNAVRNSQAAVCRPISPLQVLVSSDNELYATFSKLVRAQARLPKSNEMDQIRVAIDATLFPYYHEEIRFAALTLDGRGVTNFGDYTMVLATRTIERRASVFEENSVYFFQRRVKAWTPPPPGHRAVWDDRDKLAGAKLADRIDKDTIPDDFAKLLVHPGAAPEDDEFIEVHVYGPIHRRGIERVVGPKPKRKKDQVIQADLRRKLGEVGIRLETHE